MKRRIISAALVFVFAFMFCFSGVVSTRVVAADPINLNVKSFDLNLADSVYIKFFVETTENLELNVWHNADGSDVTVANRTPENAVKAEKLGTDGDRTVFAVKVNAKEMADNFYVQATNGVEVGKVTKYSVLKYVTTVLASEGATPKRALLESMLDYGAAAQTYFGYNTGRLANAEYFTVEVVGGTLSDGTTKGLFADGASVTLTAPATDGSNPFVSWKVGGVDVPGSEENNVFNASITADTVFTANYVAAAAEAAMVDFDFGNTGITTSGDLGVQVVGAPTGNYQKEYVTYKGRTALLDAYVTTAGQYATYGFVDGATALTSAEMAALVEGGFSVEAFYFIPDRASKASQGVICAAGNYSGTAYGWGLGQNADDRAYFVSGNGAAGGWEWCRNNTGSVSSNELTHAVVTYTPDGSGTYTYTLYVNGVQSAQSTGNVGIVFPDDPSASVNGFCIGAGYLFDNTVTYQSQGMIMVDAKIYQKSLTPAEVEAAEEAANAMFDVTADFYSVAAGKVANTPVPYADIEFRLGAAYDRQGKVTITTQGTPTFNNALSVKHGTKNAVVPAAELTNASWFKGTFNEISTKSKMQDFAQGDFTIEAFYVLNDKDAGSSKTQGVVCSTDSGNWGLAEKAGKPYFITGSSSTNGGTNTYASTEGKTTYISDTEKLVHVVAVYNYTSKTMDVYADGACITTSSTSTGNFFKPATSDDMSRIFHIGSDPQGTSITNVTFINGGMTVVDVKIYDKALSTSEITAAYNNAVSPFRP